MSTEICSAFAIFDLSASQSFSDTENGSLLIGTESLSAYRLVLRGGEANHRHWVASDVLMYCVAGRVSVRLGENECELSAEKMLYVPKHSPPCEVWGHDDSVVLIVSSSRHNPGEWKLNEQESMCAKPHKDRVEVASEDSFPASDPPSWTPITSP